MFLKCYDPVVLLHNFCPGTDVQQCPNDVCENAFSVDLIKPLWKTGFLCACLRRMKCGLALEGNFLC